MSTRKVDGLVQALGMTGITKSQVSALCRDIDERVKSFLSGPWRANGLYLWLDATHLKARGGRRGVGRRDNRQRRQPGRAAEIPGLGLGDQRPKSLVDLYTFATAGLEGVQLIISDAHEGFEGRDQPSLYG